MRAMTGPLAVLPPWARLAAMAAVLSVAACLAGPVHAAAPTASELIAGWRARIDNPLVGHLWMKGQGVRDGASLPALIGSSGARHVLLGEVHDNPDHHLLRAALIEALAATGRLRVVSEHLRPDQSAALAEQSHQDKPLAIEDFFRLVAWDKSGWPAASMFQPLYAAILTARVPLIAGEPARQDVRAVARTGIRSLAAIERRRLGLDQRLPAELRQPLIADLVAGHCGILPETMLENMADAQVYRDANMAEAMISGQSPDIATVLLAGNGHVRSDRGVPWHLRQRAPHETALAVLLIEIAPGNTDAASYLPRAPDATPAADIVLFTPRADREDPCERMRAHMQKKG